MALGTGQPVCSDAAIQACLTVNVLFGLPLRQATSFVASLLKLAGLDWPVPDCSTLCRRQKTLAVQLPYRGSGGPLHLLVDSTGIKVRGARASGTRASTAGPGGASVHDGKVIVMRSNLRWCSDGFEFTCWNGDIVRGAFIIDAHDREIIALRAVVNAGISGSEIRDIMLEPVERRFGTYRAPAVIEMLSDNGSPYIARDTQIFARQIGLKPCFTPVQSPQSNGISEAFVKTLKRDYVQVMPLPDARTVLGLIGGWIEDYNNNHPHSGIARQSW